MRLQRAAVFAVGDDAASVASHFVHAMKGMALRKDAPYPDFLYDVAILREKGSLEGTSFGATVEIDPGEKAIENGILVGERDQLVSAFRAMLNRLNDRSRLIELERANVRQELDPWTRCFVLASTCDGLGSHLFLPLIKLIHEKSPREFPMQTVGVLFLPGLFEVPGDTESETRNAAAFCCLQSLAHAYASPAQSGLREECVGRTWLVDSKDHSGRYVGTLADLEEPLGEALAIMVTQELFDAAPKEPRRAFSGFGFSQLVFPRAEAIQQAADGLELAFLTKVALRRSTIDRDEVVLDVRELVADGIRLGTLSEGIRRDRDGKSLTPRLELPLRAEENVANYIRGLEEASAAHESRLLSAKRDLIGRARALATEKLESIRLKILKLIDGHESGLYYAKSYLNELLGRGADCEIATGECLEESYNLETALDEQRQDVFALGQGQALRIALGEAEAVLAEMSEQLGALEEEAASLELSLQQATLTSKVSVRDVVGTTTERAGDAEAKVQEARAMREARNSEAAALKGRMASQEEEISRVRARVDTLEEAWQGSEERRRAFAEILSASDRHVEFVKSSLRRNTKELEEVVDGISDAWDLSRRYLGVTAIIGLPLAVILASVLAALSVSHGFIYGRQAFLWIISALGFYVVGTGLVFLQRVLFPVREGEKRKHTLETQEAALRSDLAEAVKDRFETEIELHVRNETIEQIETLRACLEEDEIHLGQLIGACRTRMKSLQEREYSYPETAFRRSVVDRDDVERLARDAILSIDEEAEKLTATDSPPLSFYATDPEGGRKLLDVVASRSRDRMERVFSPITITDLVGGKYGPLGDGEPSEARMHAFVSTLDPLVQLHDAATKRYASQSILSVGLPDAGSSVATVPQLSVPVSVFSHRDPTRIIGAHVSPFFELADLASLDEYRRAYETLDFDAEADTAGAEQEMRASALSSISQGIAEAREGVVRGLALGVLREEPGGIVYDTQRLGATVEDVSESLAGSSEYETLQRLRSVVEELLQSEDSDARPELRARVSEFRDQANEWLTAQDRGALESLLAQLAPLM